MTVKTRKKYSQQFKDQVVALIELGKPVDEVTRDMEISKDLVYAWRRKAAQLPQRGSGGAGAVGDQAVTDETAGAARAACRPPTGERHFKKSRGDFRHRPSVQIREMIQSLKERTGASIRKICAVLDYPCSSYHAAAKPTPTELCDTILGDHIEIIFANHRRRYGYRRVIDDLNDLDLTCSPARARRLMKQRGLYAIQPKNFIPKTSDGRADKPSPNLLRGQALPDGPNQVWAGDLTFIPTTVGWRYLAVVIDLFSRKIVGWESRRSYACRPRL